MMAEWLNSIGRFGWVWGFCLTALFAGLINTYWFYVMLNYMENKYDSFEFCVQKAKKVIFYLFFAYNSLAGSVSQLISFSVVMY
jgi:hypothetical protein